MATRRRRSGSRRGVGRTSGNLNPLQGTLGTLLRTTLQQVGAVKNVVERQARSSLQQLDGVMLQRRRREALMRLGEVVLDMIDEGQDQGGEAAAPWDALAEHPLIAPIIDEIDSLDDRISEREQDGDTADPASFVEPPSSAAMSGIADTIARSVAESISHAGSFISTDDGTVSAASMRQVGAVGSPSPGQQPLPREPVPAPAKPPQRATPMQAWRPSTMPEAAPQPAPTDAVKAARAPAAPAPADTVPAAHAAPAPAENAPDIAMEAAPDAAPAVAPDAAKAVANVPAASEASDRTASPSSKHAPGPRRGRRSGASAETVKPAPATPRGGIVFADADGPDPDDDLASYMTDEDVP